MLRRIFLIISLLHYSNYAWSQDLNLDEKLATDEADWDSFSDELEDGLEKTTPPSPVAETATETTTETAAEKKVDDFGWGNEEQTATATNEVDTATPAAVPQQETAEETFDLGAEENELIQLSQVISTQISDEEWRSITQSSSTTTYVVQKNDWLFKISKNLFGSGLYYPKIWSMNPHITNPHEIEPGTQLVFDPGSAILPPSLSIADSDGSGAGQESVLSSIGTPKWFEEKKRLMAKGIEVISSDEELAKVMGVAVRNEEYKKYTPPQMDIFSKPPADQYDSFGVDKGNIERGEFKQGHYLNTFITTNEVKELGRFTEMSTEGIYLNLGFKIYVVLNEGQSGQAGDLLSVFTALGKIESKSSERVGEKFVVNGTIKLLQQIDVENRKWEAVVTEVFVPSEREAKLTTYTPKIDKVFKSFNSRVIEGIIITGYREFNNYFTTGDIVYIDRGRADGVEVGNVFDVYDSVDRGIDRVIANKPVYRTGELTIISITDNFATAIISNATMDFKIGDLVKTRSSEEEQIARSNLKPRIRGVEIKDYNSKSVGDDIFSKVENVKMTSQELAELERQQSQKDVLESTQRDLKELEELEATISQADQLLNSQNSSSDSLASKDLEDVESQVYQQGLKVNLDDIEGKYGKKYLDEDLNSVNNPFGLSQYDVEEVDELLNMQKTSNENQDVLNSQSSAPIRARNKK